MEEWLGSTQGGWQGRQAPFQKQLWGAGLGGAKQTLCSCKVRAIGRVVALGELTQTSVPFCFFHHFLLQIQKVLGSALLPLLLLPLGEAQSAEMPPIEPLCDFECPCTPASAAQPAQLASVVAGPCAGCSDPGACQLHSSSCPASVAPLAKQTELKSLLSKVVIGHSVVCLSGDNVG